MGKTDLEKIKEKWDKDAAGFGGGRETSWKDLLIYKEVGVIRRHLVRDGSFLDVGCANGFCTINFASKNIPEVVGIDYSEQMIKNAEMKRQSLPDHLKRRISFRVSEVLELEKDFKKDSFSQVLSKRVICNLTELELQKKAIRNIYNVLKPKGMFLLSEPTVLGLRNINRLRKMAGLEELIPPWHNLYIDEDTILPFAEGFFKLHKIVNFSSSYYLGSRLLYAFIAKKFHLELRHDSIFNRLSLIIPNFGNFGVQRLFIFTKK